MTVFTILSTLILVSSVSGIPKFASAPEDHRIPYDDPWSHLKYLDQIRQLAVDFDVNSLAKNASSSSSSSSSTSSIFSFEASLATALNTIVNDPSKFPNVTPNCFWALLGIMKNPAALTAVVDAFGKPRSGIMQGALAWPGNFDQCVGYKAMKHCMMPFNGSAIHGNPAAASTVPGAAFGMMFSWGLCLPQVCNDKDVLSTGEFLNYLVEI